MDDPFCQCGYRKSAHDPGSPGCPFRNGYENALGQVVYKPDRNPGVTFKESAGFNRT